MMTKNCDLPVWVPTPTLLEDLASLDPTWVAGQIIGAIDLGFDAGVAPSLWRPGDTHRRLFQIYRESVTGC